LATTLIDWNKQKQESMSLFESGAVRKFDLVVGPGCLHARVRELIFGAQSLFENYLGYKVAAFEVQSYRRRDERTAPYPWRLRRSIPAVSGVVWTVHS
jgi:hypothetical protein